MTAITDTPSVNKFGLWTGRVLSGLFVAFMLFDGVMKLTMMDVVTKTTAELGYSVDTIIPIALIELACTFLYLYRGTAVLGAVLLMAIMGGAIATHIRMGNPLFSHVLFGVYLGAMMWGGLWLRDERLRSLFPFRP